MQIPLLEFGDAQAGNAAGAADGNAALARALDRALSQVGFLSIRKLGIDSALLERVYAASRGFFHAPAAHKLRYAYRSAEENFGYQGLGWEHLDPTRPADLKETFTMRNVGQLALDARRWPAADFRELMTEFYGACMAGAYRLQRVLATALELPLEFFVNCHSGENVTLRLLYYPALGEATPAQQQMGAGAHTDYGLLTLLFQDDVGGLEVLDKHNHWQAVVPVPDTIVVNSGDLLERWTNGRYRSTRHRVQPRTGRRERFSIALFVDPDSATRVAALPSCVSAAHPARYAPITAGEHLQQKIAATHLAAAAPGGPA